MSRFTYGAAVSHFWDTGLALVATPPGTRKGRAQAEPCWQCLRPPATTATSCGQSLFGAKSCLCFCPFVSFNALPLLACCEASMYLEIHVAVNFIISFLYNKIPRRRANMFGEELECLLRKKYEGHWYPEKPLKGSGYRCISFGETVESVVKLAAEQSGIAVEDVCANMPQELNIWIDPFEVSYQIGENGSINVLPLEDSKGCSSAELNRGINPDTQVLLFNSPCPSFAQSPWHTFIPCPAQPVTFTADTFAATRFGSTKLKKGRRDRAEPRQQLRMVRSPTNLLQDNSLSLSTPSLNSFRSTRSKALQSELSPNAKEFVYRGRLLQDSGLFFNGVASESQHPAAVLVQRQHRWYFDTTQVVAPIASLEKPPFMEGVTYNLNAMQCSNPSP